MTHSADEYKNGVPPSWCRGCTYYAVFKALTEMFASRELNPLSLNVVSGIGCSSRLPLFLSTFGMHTIHGRALPVAIGARLARPEVPVVVIAGDGDLFSIGTAHFVHAARKNFNITVVCLNNRMYAMTKNQASPTSPVGYGGSLTPHGKMSVPLNVIEFAISCGATCVSRSHSGDPDHMVRMLANAFDHVGFSIVEILAPCRTFDPNFDVKEMTSRISNVNTDESFNVTDRGKAMVKASTAYDFDWDPGASIPVGLFWQSECATFDSQMRDLKAEHKGRGSIKSLLSRCAVRHADIQQPERI